MSRYSPLGVLFILIVAILGISRYAEHRKAENREYARVSIPESTVSTLDADKGTKKINTPKYPPSWVDTFAWPNGVETWALILTLFVIAWQSVETHAAAEATVASVEAAKRQSELIREQMDTEVQRERARLSLEVQPIDITKLEEDCLDLISCIEITNIGHSNAFIKDGAAKFVIAPSGQWPLPLVNPEEFAPFPNTVEPSQDDPIYVPMFAGYITSTIERFAEDVASGTFSAYLYGFVEYETLGIRWHRDFGYVWTIGNSPDESIVFSHPREMDRFYITGEWKWDLRQKNTEYRKKSN
jgi:hypothetical protein